MRFLAGLFLWLLCQPLVAIPKAKFYALFLIDGRSIGSDERYDFTEGAQLDYEALQGYLKLGLRDSLVYEYRSEVLFREQITAEKVAERLDYLKSVVSPYDLVLIYYRGHAHVRNNEMILQFKNEEFERDKILKTIQSGISKPQASFLITDACASALKSKPEIEVRAIPLGLRLTDSPLKPNERVIDQLFLQVMGTVDLNSALPGKDSWSIGGRGLFTHHLLGALSLPPERLSTDGLSSVSWGDALTFINRGNEAAIRKLIQVHSAPVLEPMASQRVWVKSLGAVGERTRSTRVLNSLEAPIRVEIELFGYTAEKPYWHWEAFFVTIDPNRSYEFQNIPAWIVRSRAVHPGQSWGEFQEERHELYQFHRDFNRGRFDIHYR